MQVDRLFYRRALASALTAGWMVLGVPTTPLLAGNVPDTDSSAPTAGPNARAGALVPIRRMEAAAVPMHGRLDSAAADFVRGSAAAPGLDRSDWRVRHVSHGRDGLDHVRLDQVHDGVRVWGADVVVHASNTSVQGFNGNLVPDLDGVSTTPVFTEKEALAAAQADYAASADGNAAAAFERVSTELVILPRAGQEPRLAWLAIFVTDPHGEQGPGWWHYFVDAETGEILHHFDAIQTISQASGPGGNAEVVRTWSNQLDVTALPLNPFFYVMATSRLATVNMNHAISGNGSAVIGPLSPIGDAAINDAHGFAEVTLNMLSQWMGSNSIDDHGMGIKSRVHFGTGFENAFWDGTQMTYGDGFTKFFPLSGDVDVVAHEINHGFTTFHSGLIYELQSGGVNESFSDIAGTVTEFFNEGAAADFDLGRDVIQGPGALRFMCNPKTDGVSIDNFSQYNDSLDVHRTSGIMNKAFCRAARRLGSGSPTGAATQASVRRAGEAWYLANAAYWTQSTGFHQACEGVLDAARDLGFSSSEVLALNQSWIDVGVICGATPVPADYDGDGKDDLAIRDGAGVWRIDFAANGFGGYEVAFPGYGTSGVPVPADYDGDGKADLSVKGTDGVWYIDYAANGFGAWNAIYPGYGSTSVPVPADYDGDGKADLSVKGLDGVWYIDDSSIGGFGTWDFGYAGYGSTSVPVPADYDGDGKADLSVKGLDGVWYIDYSSIGDFGTWNAVYPGYGSTSVPVPADYDGDGKADLSVKGLDGVWYIDYSSMGDFGTWNAVYPGYGSISVPVPADYDGDGKADLSVRADSSWFVDFAANQFGSWDRLFVNR